MNIFMATLHQIFVDVEARYAKVREIVAGKSPDVPEYAFRLAVADLKNAVDLMQRCVRLELERCARAKDGRPS
jgi:hypothetical protein